MGIEVNRNLNYDYYDLFAHTLAVMKPNVLEIDTAFVTLVNLSG